MNLQKKYNTEMSLEASIRSGDLAGTIHLLRSGSDINGHGSEGLTPLMIASGLGQAQMVELLLTAGADVFTIDPVMGATALHKAAQSGNTDVIKLLLDHGAFIDQQSPVLGNTPLMDAVSYKNEDAVELFLSHGVRVKIRNYWEQTALDIAELDSLTGIIELILARIKKDNEQIATQTLISAIVAGNFNEVKELIADGARINGRVPIIGSPDDDYTPLGIAAREGRADIVGLLLDAGADLRRVIGLMRGTAVHEASYFGHIDVIRVMMEKIAQGGVQLPDLNAQGPYNGLTALHDATWHGHLEAVKILVAAGARLDIKSHVGLTPKDMAVLYGYNDIAMFLTEAQ